MKVCSNKRSCSSPSLLSQAFRVDAIAGRFLDFACCYAGGHAFPPARIACPLGSPAELCFGNLCFLGYCKCSIDICVLIKGLCFVNSEANFIK